MLTEKEVLSRISRSRVSRSREAVSRTGEKEACCPRLRPGLAAGGD